MRARSLDGVILATSLSPTGYVCGISFSGKESKFWLRARLHSKLCKGFLDSWEKSPSGCLGAALMGSEGIRNPVV